jgi:hypothetical protein
MLASGTLFILLKRKERRRIFFCFSALMSARLTARFFCFLSVKKRKMLALPLEIIGRVLELCDARTIARMRATCKAVDALVEADLSLEIHQKPAQTAIYNKLWVHRRSDIFHDESLLRVIQAAPPGPPYFGPYTDWHVALLRRLDDQLRRVHVSAANLDALAGLQCVEKLSTHEDVDQELNLPNLAELTIHADLRAAIPSTVRSIACQKLVPNRDRTDLGRLHDLSCYIRTVSLSNLQSFGPTPALRVLEIYSHMLVDADGEAKPSWPPELRELRIVTNGCRIKQPPALPSTLQVLEIHAKMPLLFPIGPGAHPQPFEHLDLSHMRGLRNLTLKGLGLRSFRSIRLPDSLRTLDISYNDFQTLRGVKFPPHLTTLKCRQTPRLPLSRLPKFPGCNIEL